jgi:CRISPR-associated endoribonuclease Cas6
VTDLLAAVITLEAQAAGELDRFEGRAMHALFLDLLERADPARSAALHDSDTIKPFTSSDLIGPRPGGDLTGLRRPVRSGDIFRWRITAFEAELAALWLDGILPHLPATVTIGDLPFAVRGWTADPAQDAWAGAGGYAELARRHTLGERLPSPHVSLRFVSPTTFRSGGVHVPLPLPSLTLGHWLEKWNAFAPTALHPDVRAFAEQEVVVNRYDLHTEVVQFGKAMIIGFVGQCSLLVRSEDPYWRRIPGLLAAYGFWCGTGHRTPYGFGQTRPGK